MASSASMASAASTSFWMLLSVVIGDKQLQKVEQHPCGHRRLYEEGEMVFNKIRRPVDPIHQSQPKPNHCQSDEQLLETAFYVHPAQIVTQGLNEGMPKVWGEARTSLRTQYRRLLKIGSV